MINRPYVLPILLLSGLLLGLARPTVAEDESIGAIFLTQPTGARPAAMAGAFIAVADDVNTVFWNPAGIVRVLRTELMAVHTEFIQGFRDEYFAFCMPLSTQDALGINCFFSYIDSLEKTTFVSADSSVFGAYDAYLSLAWSHAFNKYYTAGVSLKGIYQVIDTYSAWSMACDLGFLMTGLVPNLTAGITIKNLGKPIKFIEKSSLLPMTAEAGAAYRLFNNTLLVSLAVCIPFQQEIVFKAGAEYNLEEIIFFRAGYKYSQFGNDLGPLSGLSCGLGADISEYKVSYAYAPYSDLGDTHRISLTFPFGKSILEEEKLMQRLEKQLHAKQEKIILGYMKTAARYSKKGDYSNEVFYYEKILALNPKYPYLKKKISAAKHHLKQHNAEKHFKLGMQSYKNQEYITALIEWNKVYEIMPPYKNISHWLKQVNNKLSQDKSSPTGKPQNNKIKKYFSQGFEYLKNGQYRRALDTWHKLLVLDPGNRKVKIYLNKTKTKMQEEINDLLKQAKTCCQRNEWPSAVRKWKKILKMDPKNISALQQLEKNRPKIRAIANKLYLEGVQNYVNNKLIEAISNWQDVLILDTEDEKALKNLKRAREKLKDLESIE